MTESDDRQDTSGPEGGGESLAPVTYLFGRSSEQPIGRATAPADTSGISRAFGLDAELADDDDPWAQDDEDDPADDACLALEARDAALRALGRKGHSQRELERMLVKLDVPESIAVDVVAGLKADGVVDDSALAQDLVGRLQERKGLGRSAIAAELTRRLLAPSAISYALELVDTGDELARAREVAQKRASQLRGLDRETAVRRLSGYLQRRGYSGSTVRSAVESALPATGTGGRSVRFE